MIKTFAYVTIFLVFGVSIKVSALPTDSVKSKTFTYKTLPDTSLQLTVFYPEHVSGKLPAMIMFHGGAWRVGSRKVMFPFCEYFAKRGIITVSASYRLLKEGQDTTEGIAICIKDAKSAVRWVKEHAAELQIDTNKIALSGGSSGGHLATMCAFDDKINDPLDNKKTSSKAGTLVLLNPAYPPFNPRIMPFGLVTRSSTSAFFVYGTNDPLRKPGKLFLDELVSKNNKAEIWYAPNQKHAFFNKEDWRIATMIKMDEYLTAQHFLQPLAKPMLTSELKFISSDTP